MYIVAIAWIYVVFMMSVTETTVVAGIMTFLLYGVLPLSIILYLMGTPQRKRDRVKAEKILRDEKDAQAAGIVAAPLEPSTDTDPAKADFSSPRTGADKPLSD
jgi:membrane protein implicated in regulation of membrane protease activity